MTCNNKSSSGIFSTSFTNTNIDHLDSFHDLPGKCNWQYGKHYMLYRMSCNCLISPWLVGYIAFAQKIWILNTTILMLYVILAISLVWNVGVSMTGAMISCERRFLAYLGDACTLWHRIWVVSRSAVTGDNNPFVLIRMVSAYCIVFHLHVIDQKFAEQSLKYGLIRQ